MLYIRLKLAASSHILTKFMDALLDFLSLKAWAVRRVCVTGVLTTGGERRKEGRMTFETLC